MTRGIRRAEGLVRDVGEAGSGREDRRRQILLHVVVRAELVIEARHQAKAGLAYQPREDLLRGAGGDLCAPEPERRLVLIVVERDVIGVEGQAERTGGSEREPDRIDVPDPKSRDQFAGAG
jgi:hypothetical protein